MKKIKGFTVMEIVIVISVLAILVLIAKPSYDKYQKTTVREQAKAELLKLANLGVVHALQNNYDFDRYNPLGGQMGTDFPKENPQYTLEFVVEKADPSLYKTNRFFITASPLEGSKVYGDGVLCINDQLDTDWAQGEDDSSYCVPSASTSWDKK